MKPVRTDAEKPVAATMEPAVATGVRSSRGGGSTLVPPSVSLIIRGSDDQEPDVRPLDFGLIKRMIGYMGRHRLKRNTLLVLTILRSAQLPLVTWALSRAISGPVATGDWLALKWGVIIYGVLAISTDFVFHFRQRLALELAEDVVFDLRRDVFAHLQRMPMSFYNRTKLGRIISRVTSDIEALRIGVRDVFFVSVVQLGQMLVTAALMLHSDPVLFFVMVGMAPILWAINRHFRKELSDPMRAVQESFSRVVATIAESVSGIRVTQGFVREGTNAGIFRRLMDTHVHNNMAVARSSALLTPLLELNTQFFIALLLLIGGWRVLHGEPGASVANLVEFFFLANLFFSPVLVLGTQYANALTAMAGAERVFKLLDRKPEWADEPDAQELPDPRAGKFHVPGAKYQGTERARGAPDSETWNLEHGASPVSRESRDLGARVEFRNVSFAYDEGRPVLHEVNFVAAPGQTIALVGHTGSGKSSIINLAAKFYLPTAGEVVIDGREIRTVSSESLHRQMGIVLQQNFLFSGSILDNIRFGRPDASDDDVIAAIRALDCLDVIGEMPEGLATRVGERGAGISLGQRQVVCFARALLADPRILVLDEATSSIDTLTEARLQRALHKLLKGRTSFVVAHRLSTIRDADLVLVMEQGRIVERGKHEELVARGGVYATLHRQFVASTSHR